METVTCIKQVMIALEILVPKGVEIDFFFHMLSIICPRLFPTPIFLSSLRRTYTIPHEFLRRSVISLSWLYLWNLEAVTFILKEELLSIYGVEVQHEGI